jgi:cyclopropane fatty-acyl-phospholipid synthase-like methyltransferase
MSEEQFSGLLVRKEFPRSAKYDAHWVLQNQMGLHPLWLTEWLCQVMPLKAGMRVLDLGCGKVLSSIFLAKEYGVQVWATDLWIAAEENRQRIEAMGVEPQVFPIHADARMLPYANEFFDAIICIDAYIYFGTDDLYLDYLHRFLKPGGRLGVVLPGLMQEVKGSLPEHLRPFWAQECWSWHTVTWWKEHWDRTELLNIEVADTMPDGVGAWLQWKRARQAAGDNRPSVQTDIGVMEQDRGEYMGFMRIVGSRR